MICKYCGQETSDDSIFCSKCGKPVAPSNNDSFQNSPYQNGTYQNGYNMGYQYPPVHKQETCGQSIAAFVLGIAGLVAWLIPLIGIPVGITGLALGLVGRGKGEKTKATIGLILSCVTIFLSVANSALGVYLAYIGY